MFKFLEKMKKESQYMQPFKRTAGTIKYSITRLEEGKGDKDCKWAKFNFDNHGTCIEMLIDDIEGLSDIEIVNKAIRELVNFSSIQIRDCI